MIALSTDQSDALASAVEAAAGRAEVCDAVESVYRCLQDAIDLRQPRCVASGRCCHFESYGHRLFVTTMELAAFVVAGGGGVEAVGEGCPFQVGRLCGVHAIRPFGCRVFFCDETAAEWQNSVYEHLHGELKRLHDRHGVPYFYVEWRQALGVLAKMTARPAP